MKCREIMSAVVFVFVAWSFFMVNHNNQLENERLDKESRGNQIASVN